MGPPEWTSLPSLPGYCDMNPRSHPLEGGACDGGRACGFVFRVPRAPVSTAPHPEATPAAGGRWRLRFMTGIADRPTAEAAGEKLLPSEDCFLPESQAVHNLGPL
jgi:hypothetical protein